MKHSLQTKAAPLPQQTTLLKQTYLIIDSKIRYIDYQVQKYFNNCICPASDAEDDIRSMENIGLLQNLDKILLYVDTLRKDLELLQILKVWLKEETVDEVYGLLQENAYKEYSAEILENMLKQKACFLQRMRSRS
jgi:hypothetical protein